MPAQATWAIELPAFDHPASFEIEDSATPQVVLDNNELRGAAQRSIERSVCESELRRNSCSVARK
jgi:hypothetical protein